MAILRQLADAGVTMIRCDAVGYAIKKPGDSCFMMPETFAFIDAFAGMARGLGLEVSRHAPVADTVERIRQALKRCR